MLTRKYGGNQMIEIKGLTKEFRTDAGILTVLDNIDIMVEKGDIFGVIGMSGAGKSTLIRCINLLEKPTMGSIKIEGTEVTTLKQSQLDTLRKNIGMIFQNFNLLMQKNVRRNIAFGLEIIKVKDYECEGMSKEEYDKLSYFKKRAARKKDINNTVDKLLKIVELEDKANSYPAQLSGGQKQRVAIARALATNPKILLCDEATSALDTMTTNSILTLLKKINKERGVTIVIITHEMDVVEKVCNKVAVLDQAKVVEQGNVKSVLFDSTSAITKRLVGGNNE